MKHICKILSAILVLMLVLTSNIVPAFACTIDPAYAHEEPRPGEDSWGKDEFDYPIIWVDTETGDYRDAVIPCEEVEKNGYCSHQNLSYTFPDGYSLGLPNPYYKAMTPTIEGGVLIKYNGPGGDVVIPDGVTSIGNRAFANCKDLTSVTIPDGVTTIGAWAFEHCENLTSVTIPSSVTSIGDFAFWYCSGLTSVAIPNSVTEIGEEVFAHCTGLASVTIPNSVTTIENCAFEDCTSLTSVTIPNSVTSIGNGAFVGCTGLAGVTIPNSVTTIKGSAFQSCTGLTSVTIPDSVITIEGAVFQDCTGLTSITIPNSVTTIGDFAFQGCSSLTSVTIPDGVTDIGLWTFRYCTKLTSVTIPSSVTWIMDAFSGCYSLTDIYYGGNQEQWATACVGTIPDHVTIHHNSTAPSQPVVPTAYVSTQIVDVDGKAVTFGCYALKDENGNLTNYIKLRDLATLLNGSAAQFQVGWDGSVTITTKTAYTPNGSELSTPYTGNREYQETSAVTKVNGQAANLSAFVLNDDQGGGYTYYQLRDLGQALGFNVGWSADKGVFLETDKPYDPNN